MGLRMNDDKHKKSAKRPLSDLQTGAPRNENRFASSNKHRTKKNASSIFRGKGNTASDEPMLPHHECRGASFSVAGARVDTKLAPS